MEKFFSLPIKKQHTIIDAALQSFGTNGYKKSSVSDIAAAAGISKAMIFHYFGTKKMLYLYLVDMSTNFIMKEVEEKFDHTVLDLFERIKLAIAIKISALKKHPAILSFLTSIYLENDEEVKEDIKTVLAKGEDFRNKTAFDGMDESKFKDGIDPKLVFKMLIWLGEGWYATQLSNNPEVDFDALFKEFDACLNLLKYNFYKEGYL